MKLKEYLEAIDLEAVDLEMVDLEAADPQALDPEAVDWEMQRELRFYSLGNSYWWECRV